MGVYIAIIVGLIILIVIIGAVINNINTKVTYDNIEIFCLEKNIQYRKAERQIHDIEIEGEDYIIVAKIASIPKNSSVTINSRDTWCLRFGGHRKGRSYPNKQYMSELKNFLLADYKKTSIFRNPDNKKVQKVVILHPSTEKVLKYINESEIVEVTSKDLAYDVKVIQAAHFNEEFDNLLF